MNAGDVVAFQVEGGVECSWKSAGINPVLWRVKVMNSGLQARADGNPVEAGPRPSGCPPPHGHHDALLWALAKLSTGIGNITLPGQLYRGLHMVLLSKLYWCGLRV